MVYKNILMNISFRVIKNLMISSVHKGYDGIRYISKCWTISIRLHVYTGQNSSVDTSTMFNDYTGKHLNLGVSMTYIILSWQLYLSVELKSSILDCAALKMYINVFNVFDWHVCCSDCIQLNVSCSLFNLLNLNELVLSFLNTLVNNQSSILWLNDN